RARAPQRALEFTDQIAFGWFYLGRGSKARDELDRMMATVQTPSQRAAIWHTRASGDVHEGAYRAGLADLTRAAAYAREAGDPAEQALARLDAATMCLLSRNDHDAAFRLIDEAPDLEKRITYQDFYFQYWPYWGGRMKALLLAGDVAAAEA